MSDDDIRALADAWAKRHGCKDIRFCNTSPLSAFMAGYKLAMGMAVSGGRARRTNS